MKQTAAQSLQAKQKELQVAAFNAKTSRERMETLEGLSGGLAFQASAAFLDPAKIAALADAPPEAWREFCADCKTAFDAVALLDKWATDEFDFLVNAEKQVLSLETDLEALQTSAAQEPPNAEARPL